MATMDELDKVKKILAEASVTLGDNLQPKEVMLELKAEGALSTNQKERIKAKPSEADKVHELIDLFFTKSVADYDKFRKILAKHRPDLNFYLLSLEQNHNFRPGPDKETAAELTKKARIDDLYTIKKILPKAILKLRSQLLSKDILQELSAMGALEKGEVQTIKTEGGNEDQVNALLDKFDRKSASDYEKLREALAKVQPDMFHELESLEKEHDFQPHNKIVYAELPVVSPIRGRHVMISYATEAKERMVKLKDELTKCGVNIMMDEDQHGDLERATAIEEADAILLCFSEKYTTDVCPQEAEYATFLDKPIIPIQFDDHKPTGLLALIINAHECYDVKTEEMLMENLPKIKQALEKHTPIADSDSKYAPSEGLEDEDYKLIKKVSIKLKDGYMSSLCKKATLPWNSEKLLDLDKIFVPVTIDIEVKGATDDAVKKHLNSYQDILKNSEKSKRFLLVGHPGQGKSVLCAKIAHDWCCRTALSPLKHIQLLFILQLGKINHTSNIEDAICEQLLTRYDAKRIDRVKLGEVIRKLGQSVMTVFDGVDESPPNLFLQPEADVGNVLDIIRLHDMLACRVIVTTRPWREKDVISCTEKRGKYERLELQWMSKSNVKTLVDKYFHQNDSPEATILGNKLLQQIEDNKIVVDTSTPLLVVLLCWYFTETKGEGVIPVKISELYENILNIMYKTTQCQIEKKG